MFFSQFKRVPDGPCAPDKIGAGPGKPVRRLVGLELVWLQGLIQYEQ